MSKRTRVLLVKYGSCFLLTFLWTIVYVLDHCTGDASILVWSEWISALQTGIQETKAVDWYHWICDGLTLPSMLLLSAGLMIWISNAGAFDILGYTFKSFIRMFTSDRDSHETYGDYVAEKKEKRIHGYGFLIISGSISMGLTLLFLALYCAAA